MSTGAALLFDLDGCVVDSLPSIAGCWAEVLPQFGAPAPSSEEIRPYVGPPVDAVARRLLPAADEDTIARMVATYRECSVAAVDGVDVFPGILELLDDLRVRGLQLAVATSKSIEVVEPLLERLHLRQRFTSVHGTARDELGTDKSTIVRRALRAVAPRRALALVGDRHHDVHGAHANGILAIGALWGYGSRDELRAAGADRLADAPADVIDILDGLAAG